MKKARTFFMVSCIAAACVISGFINIMGGIGFCLPVNFDTYASYGICLFVSSAFLISGTVTACLERVLIPALFNIIGTCFYIYTVSKLYSIPNGTVPKEVTEPIAERHLLTVIVTVLLAVLTLFNFFGEKNVKKRAEKSRSKNNEENRPLSDDEKIV